LLTILISVIAWAIGLALTLGFLGLLVWLLRVILKDSVGQPGFRAVLLSGFGLGLFVLWSASRIVP
jgi:ABC-type nickel/cobalt efflux system permease component RcnA